uniref:ATP-dependent DNA helicase DDM1,Lymphoid-specific helicase chimera n=1 Tax=Arabidopsis thaliana TaxID=3702 RepID=UPI00383BF73A
SNAMVSLRSRKVIPASEMVSDGKTEKDASGDSPTSVLNEEENCEEKSVTVVEEEILLAKNGDSSLISEAMAQEEEQLLKLREDEEKANNAGSAVAPNLNETQFTKLDELLTQTQLYSEFLLEKMEDITINGIESESQKAEPEKTGRGRKRKAASQYNNTKAKRAVAAMISRSKEDGETINSDLTEEETVIKLQNELCPLLTGGQLKSYQLKGVKWLISLWQNGLNGILADQMGLGKTIQTIGFLSHLKGNGLDGPYLVIAPLSTLSNWFNEIARFTPSINAIIYHGDKNQRDELRRKHMPKTVGPKFPIVITSYEVAMNDAKRILRHYPWKYVVIDEGHRLKNHKCKLLRELKHLKMDNKLLLTGTPLQNNLSELWSLLNFILPDIFTSHDEFESWFDFSEKNKNEATKEEEEKRRAQVVSKLHGILRPFILRRMKCDVELSLPRKKEIIMYATMTDHQKKFQEHLVNNTLEAHLGENAIRGIELSPTGRPKRRTRKSINYSKIDDFPNELEKLISQIQPEVDRERAVVEVNIPVEQGWKGKLNNLVIQLRKNCNHPDLLQGQIDGSYLYPPVEEIVGQCGKFRLLERLLVRLFANNHKVLIFSQWTKLLDIMDYYFSEKGFEVCRIDGSVKLDERRRQIKDFSDEKSSCSIFLLSTRAGGLGINLTAADTCILYDSDWNPQMDLQAMDRCHRIGQTKPVHVYRLSTAQSIETRVLKRAYSKLKLEHVVIGQGQFHQERAKSSTPLEEEDILALLKEDETAEDKLIQTDISDADLDRLLDRSDLTITAPGETQAAEAFPVKGPGWEVVLPSSGGMLSSLNS